MTRIAAILFLVVALIGGGFYAGQRHDKLGEAQATIKTTERLKDADKSEGNAADDDAWVRDLVNGL